MKIRTKFVITFLIITLTTALTGIMGIIFTSNVGDHGVKVGRELAPLGDAAMEIKLTATTAHLIFEEIIAGDESEDVQVVWDLLDETLWYCDAILKGGSNDEGAFYASNDEVVLSKVREVKKTVLAFIESAKFRYNNRVSASGTGSEVDQQFDALYEEIQDEISQLIDGSDDNARSKQLGKTKYLLANGHLFFEELMSGDDENSYVDIKNQFTEAMTILNRLRLTRLANQTKDFIAVADKRISAANSNNSAGSEADAKFDEEFEMFIALADEAEEVIHDDMDAGFESLFKEKSKARLVMIIISALAIVLAILFASALTNDIVKQLGGEIYEAAEIAEQFANGNLTYEFKRGNNIGLYANLQNMAERLKSIVVSILAGSDSIAGASQQLSSSSQQMSQGASEQASTVEEVSSTMEEISANIQQNTDNSSQTEKIATSAKTGIEEVTESSQETITATKEISEKITIITDIAFQTNILALNAAVEAARAGEHGKGFAVVAAEVRKLAEKSKVAAEEIVALAQNGFEQAQKTGKRMEEMLPEVSKTAQLVQEISSASHEQTNGVAQVNSSVQQLNDVTQQNAAASEELATSAEELSGQAEQLKEIISFFRLDNNFSNNAFKVQKFAKQPEVEKVNLKENQNSDHLLTDFPENSDDRDFEKF